MSTSCHRASRLVRRRVAGTALVLALAGSACGADDPITEPVAEATTTTTASSDTVATTTTSAGPAAEATTTTSAVEPEPAEVPPTSTAAVAGTSPEPEPSNGAQATADFAGGPSWSEILDRLDASEQSCIREVLDEAGLDEAGWESALSRRLFSDDFPMAEDAAMFACLASETATDVFVTSMIAAMEPELGVEVSDDERACLRDRSAGIDLAALVSANEISDDDASALVLLSALVSCIPDAFISSILADFDMGLDDLSEEEKACARELLVGLDLDGPAGSEDNEEAAVEAIFALSFGLIDCLPGLAEGEMALPPGEFSPEEATPAAVGEPIEGSLDSADDTDLFVFDAVGGEFYEIGVEPGTLEDPMVTLYDADGAWLDYNDDSGDSLASLLYWSADSSGPLYVEVGGYGAGSYTLTVEVSDVDDDHANSSAGATAVEVGEAVGGSLQYDGDVDYFVFDAVEGEFYEIGVEPGTLEDPTVTLYDADGAWLDHDDDSGGSLAPRLFWPAEVSGPLYVEVGGYGSGSYTLTVARR